MSIKYNTICVGNINVERSYPTKLIINDKTMILYMNGKKAVVKCQKGDKFDKEKGLLLAIAKIYGVSYNKLTKILDNAQIQKPESQKKGMLDGMFNVGDVVKITEPDKHYPTYIGWFDIYAKSLKSRYTELRGEERENINKSEYTILAKGGHENFGHMLYAISRDKDGGNVILMDEQGLKRIGKRTKEK